MFVECQQPIFQESVCLKTTSNPIQGKPTKSSIKLSKGTQAFIIQKNGITLCSKALKILTNVTFQYLYQENK